MPEAEDSSPGAPETAIPALPSLDLQPTRSEFITREISAPALVDLAEAEADCPICYRDMRCRNLSEIGLSTIPVRVPCAGRHVFCRDCLRTWIEEQRQHTCPMCREVFLREEAGLLITDMPDVWLRYETLPFGPSGSGRWHALQWDEAADDASRARAELVAQRRFDYLYRHFPSPTARGESVGSARRRARLSSDASSPPMQHITAANYRPENHRSSLPSRARHGSASRRPGRTSTQLPTLRVRDSDSQMPLIPTADWEMRPSGDSIRYTIEGPHLPSQQRSQALRARPFGRYQPRIRHPALAMYPGRLSRLLPVSGAPDFQRDVDESGHPFGIGRASREFLDLDSDAEDSYEANL